MVRRLAAHVELMPICPEVAVGLGVPREPIRLVRRRGRTVLIQPTTGHDLTEPMHDFTSRYLGELPEVEGFLLKARSPSCGIHGVKVFPGAHAALPVGRDAGTVRRLLFWRGSLTIQWSTRGVSPTRVFWTLS